jgi:2-keto-4-pentenoate hydratase/2-oxohepta-3-ene-1,7-dioic acid hydratase in catechol pathway
MPQEVFMKLVTFRTAGRESWGAMSGSDQIVDGPSQLAAGISSIREVLEREMLEHIASRMVTSEPTHRVGDVELLPPIPDAGKILCAGVNYPSHREESGFEPRPEYPTIFIRFGDSQVGTNTAIVRPPGVRSLDYEGEIAVVIGAHGHRVDEGSASALVAGYSCFNDFSIREFQRQGAQWTPGKNFVGVGAFGPWLVTADEFGSANDMELRTRVNGRQVQYGRLSEALFSVSELIAYVTAFTPLAPGDVIVTGTPGGVGFAMDPPLFLGPGDVVEVEVSGVGTLHNQIVADKLEASAVGRVADARQGM